MCLAKSKEIKSEDKCQFFGSTNMNNIEVQQAIGLEITKSHEDIIDITVRQGTANSGFMLRIGKMEGVKCVIFKTLDSQEKSVNVLDDSTNISVYAAHLFKDLLEQHQKTIKKLSINANIFENNYDFGIKRLSQMKELAMETRYLTQFLTKLKHPLDILKVYGETSHARSEMLLKVHLRTSTLTRLHAPNIAFDFEELLKLSSKYVIIHIGQLTEEDLASFIRLWQRGEIETRLEQMTWNLDNSLFNIQKLFSYLRVLGVTKNKSGWFEINHINDTGKRVLIFIQQNSLTFEWNHGEEVTIDVKN